MYSTLRTEPPLFLDSGGLLCFALGSGRESFCRTRIRTRIYEDRVAMYSCVHKRPFRPFVHGTYR